MGGSRRYSSAQAVDFSQLAAGDEHHRVFVGLTAHDIQVLREVVLFYLGATPADVVWVPDRTASS